MTVDHMNVIVENGEMNEVEVKSYITYIRKLNRGKTIKSLELIIGENCVDLKYTFAEFPFQRIRRLERSKFTLFRPEEQVQIREG